MNKTIKGTLNTSWKMIVIPTAIGLLSLMVLTSLLLITGCEKINPSATPLAFSTAYQAVFLDNGQVFFGKLEKAGTPYPILRDVFYVQSQVNKDTKEVKSNLIKMGKEWHEPDLMYINAPHILMIEPVSPESRLAQLIKEASAPKKES